MKNWQNAASTSKAKSLSQNMAEAARDQPKVAYEHGAVGCLIYSDLKTMAIIEVMYIRKAHFVPNRVFNAGSVMDMPVYPGDP